MTDSVAQPQELPEYLHRYPHWSGLGHRWEKGLENLRAATVRCRYGYVSLSFDELLGAVDRLDAQPAGGAPVLVGEVIDRLDILTADDVERLVEALSEIHQRNMPRGSCLLVDHALQRLLFLLQVPAAHDLAFACAHSERTLRRRAAYKFYAEHGLDEQVRRLLVRQFADGSLEEPKLIATDQALVQELGLAAVLAIAPTTQLRKVAIEAVMGILPPETVAAVCEHYPQELTWAVFDQRRSDYIQIIMEMIDDYRTDPYLLHRVVDCIARIGGHAELEYALDGAATVFDADIPAQWQTHDAERYAAFAPQGFWSAEPAHHDSV